MNYCLAEVIKTQYEYCVQFLMNYCLNEAKRTLYPLSILNITSHFKLLGKELDPHFILQNSL